MPERESFQERRLFPRFVIQIPANFIDPSSNQASHISTHDISVEGLGIFLDKALNSGAKLEVCLKMMDNGEEIITKGRIVWISPIDAHKYRVGIKLDGLQLQPIPLVLRTIRLHLDARTRYR